jgi:AcrR family transcriptional regulator
MAKKEDLRVTKTKRAIEDAFISLLREMPFDKITVQQIASRALINKGTFYRHYHDKYELAQKVCANKLTKLEDDVNSWVEKQTSTNKEDFSTRLMASLISSLYEEIGDIYTLSLLSIEDVDIMAGLRQIVTSLLTRYPAPGMEQEEIETISWIATRLVMGYESYYNDVEKPMNPYDFARLTRTTTDLYLSWIPSSSFEVGLRFWEHRG